MKHHTLLPAIFLIGCALLISGCATSWCLKTAFGLVPVSYGPLPPEGVEGAEECTLLDFLTDEERARLAVGCNVVGTSPSCYGCKDIVENGSFEYTDSSRQEPGLANWSHGSGARTVTLLNEARPCVGNAMLVLPRPDDVSAATQTIVLSDYFDEDENKLPEPAVVQASVLVNRAGNTSGPPFQLNLDIIRGPNASLGFSETLDADDDPDTWETLLLERLLPDDATELRIFLNSAGDFGAEHDYLFDYVQVAIGPTKLYDLKLEKRALDANGNPVDTLTVNSLLVYEVILTNLGPDTALRQPGAQHRIIVRDELPFNLTTENPSIFETVPEVTQGLYTFDEATRTLLWTLDQALAPGATDTLRMVVRPSTSGILSNTARIISGLGGDSDFANDADLARTVVAANENSPPVATSDEATTTYGTPVDIDVLANDFDPDGDAIAVAAVGQPFSGTAEIINNGLAVRYTPDHGTIGTVSFGYYLVDERGATSNEAEIVVEVVAGANSAPVVTDPINDFSVNVDPPESCVFHLNTHFDDPDGDRLSYTYTRSSNAVTVDIQETNGSAMTVTGSFFGQATVTVTAQDPGGLSVSDTFEVNAALATDCAGNNTAP